MEIFLRPEFVRGHLETRGLSNKSDAILALGQPALGLKADWTRDVPVGASRFGGLPDLPPEVSWPEGNSGPLSFLLQINCQELAEYDIQQVLPHEGMLYFFYDVINQPWGGSNEDGRDAAVIYVPRNQQLVEAAVPAGLNCEEGILFQVGLSFEKQLSLEEHYKTTLQKAGLCEQEIETYFDLYDEIVDQAEENNLPTHRLLGVPDEIQGAMENDCARAYNATPEGRNSTPDEWRLLLQLDSDDELRTMWGDSGMLYYWIRDDDLTHQNFSETWTALQCY